MSTTIEKIVAPALAEGDVLEELTILEAKNLTAQLRESLHESSKLYIHAWQHQVWKTLGYDSWDAYINGEFGDLRVKLTGQKRTETVIEMAEAGMPTRAIATSTGISKSSVNREIQKAQAAQKLPETLETTGLDGKVRTSKKKPALEMDDSFLDMPVGDLGIGYFKGSTPTQKPEKEPQTSSPQTTDHGLQQVQDLARQMEEAVKVSILSNQKQKFDPADVTHQLVTSTTRSLLATAGLINQFNLQPDLTGENEEIINILESSVATLDAVLAALRGNDE